MATPKDGLGQPSIISTRFSQTTQNKHVEDIKTLCFLCQCRFKTNPQDPLPSNQIVITTLAALRNTAVASAKNSRLFTEAHHCPCGKENMRQKRKQQACAEARPYSGLVQCTSHRLVKDTPCSYMAISDIFLILKQHTCSLLGCLTV